MAASARTSPSSHSRDARAAQSNSMTTCSQVPTRKVPECLGGRTRSKVGDVGRAARPHRNHLFVGGLGCSAARRLSGSGRLRGASECLTIPLYKLRPRLTLVSELGHCQDGALHRAPSASHRRTRAVRPCRRASGGRRPRTRRASPRLASGGGKGTVRREGQGAAEGQGAVGRARCGGEGKVRWAVGRAR